MLSTELYFLRASSNKDQEISEVLESYLKEGIPAGEYYDALVLGVAVNYDKAPVRNLAKKLIKKQGGAGLKAAFELIGKKNYLQKAHLKTLLPDLESLRSVDGFSMTQFARVMSLKFPLYAVEHREIRRLYLEEASDQELERSFLEDGYNPNDESLVLGFSTRHLGFDLGSIWSGELDDRQLSILWRVALAHSDKVTEIGFNTAGDGQLPDEIPVFPKLVRLSIAADTMTAIPAALLTQPALKFLELRGSKISEIPDSLGQAKELLLVLLDKQHDLRALGEALGELTQLMRLTIRDSGITEIPESIGRCGELTDIDIRHTPLKRLPASLADCKKLTTIRLTGVLGLLVPPEVLAMPSLDDRSLEQLKEAMEDPGSYAPVFEVFHWRIESFGDKPAVKEALAEWSKSNDAERAHLGELVLAVSRCYWDDEHDSRHESNSNTLYGSMIAEKVSKTTPLFEANKAVQKRGRIDDDTKPERVRALFKAVSKVKGFDLQAFARFVFDMSGNPTVREFLAE